MVHIRKKWLEQLLSGAHFVRSICGQLIWYIVGLLTKGLGWPVGFGSRYIPFSLCCILWSSNLLP
jgi:hypothetical protein